jgi:hypothetical protein
MQFAGAVPEAVTAAERARRHTWVSAGVLLVLSALAGFMARGPLVVIHPAGDWLFAAGAILFVIGIGRPGSVTGRRFVGTAATILLAVAPMTRSLWAAFVPDGETNPNTVEDISALVAMLYYGTVFALAIVSVIQIARARVIPSPWRWASAWVLVWTILTVAIGLNLFGSAPLGSTVSVLGSGLAVYGPGAGVIFLGILGIVLGSRGARDRVTMDAGRRWRRA